MNKDGTFNCIDLFCGCGGLSEGFKLAGFNIVGGIDFNAKAIDTYNHNFNLSNKYLFNPSKLLVEILQIVYKMQN